MTDTDAGRFTVGVFQDVTWAERGIEALIRGGILAESLSVIALTSPDVETLIARVLPGAPEHLRIAGLGAALAVGPIVRALQGPGHDLAVHGLAGTMRRIGYQSHDARIFDALTTRGGVLVAIHSEPRAADALAVLHAYGGGNAAIGAWTGRV